VSRKTTVSLRDSASTSLTKDPPNETQDQATERFWLIQEIDKTKDILKSTVSLYRASLASQEAMETLLIYINELWEKALLPKDDALDALVNASACKPICPACASNTDEKASNK